MDRAVTEQRLAQAEEHVALGERHFSRQREMIAELERVVARPRKPGPNFIARAEKLVSTE